MFGRGKCELGEKIDPSLVKISRKIVVFDPKLGYEK